MAASAVLAIKILADDQASKVMGKAGDATSKWGDRSKKAAGVAAGVLGGMVAFGKAAFDSASNLQQQSGAVEAVFGKNASTVKQFAKNAGDATGLASADYQEMAALIGSQLGNMGVSQDKLAGSTNDLIAKGADLSAQFGGSSKDAVAALSSALKGEMDPLEKYGINLSQTKIQSELAARGQDKLTGKALIAAKTQATLALVQKESAKTTGAFARESDTAAGAQARSAAAMENAKAKLGDVLLPIVAKAATEFAKMAGFVEKNSAVIQKIAPIVAALAAVILIVVAATRVYAAVQAAFNVIMGLNPVVLIVIAIIALIAIIVIAYKKSSQFRAIVQAVGAAGKAAFNAIVIAVKAVVAAVVWFAKKVAAVAKAVAGFAVAMATAIRDKIKAGIAKVQAAVAAIRAKFNEWKSKVVALAGQMRDAVRDKIKAGITAVQTKITQIKTAFQTWKDKAVAIAGAIRDAVRDKIKAGIDKVKEKLDILKTAFTTMKDKVVTTLQTIKDKITSALTNPFDTVKSAVESVVGWISRIKFPSLPGWLSKLTGTSASIAAPTNPAAMARGGASFAVPRGAGGFGGSGGGSSSGGLAAESGAGASYTFNITVDALDPASAARAVTQAIDYSDRLRGKPVSIRRPSYAR